MSSERLQFIKLSEVEYAALKLYCSKIKSTTYMPLENTADVDGNNGTVTVAIDYRTRPAGAWPPCKDEFSISIGMYIGQALQRYPKALRKLVSDTAKFPKTLN